MNMLNKSGELIVIRNNNSLMNYIEEQLGSDVVLALDKKEEEYIKSKQIADYERDMAWDSVHNLEKAISEGGKDLIDLLYYINTTKRLNRDTMAKMVFKIQKKLDLNNIEY